MYGNEKALLKVQSTIYCYSLHIHHSEYMKTLLKHFKQYPLLIYALPFTVLFSLAKIFHKGV